MSEAKSSDSPDEKKPYGVPHRPPEVDKFVDTFLSTVCDTSRRYILELLAIPHVEEEASKPEWRSGDIARAIGLSAPTTSEHLRLLTSMGLVISRREGNVVYYSLRNRILVQAFQDLLMAVDNHRTGLPLPE